MSEVANKRRAKTHAKVAKAAWHNNEPNFNVFDYTLSMSRNLNFYNSEIDSKDKQEWTLTYWKEQGHRVTPLRKLNPGYFNQTGALVRLIQRGISLSAEHISYLDEKFDQLNKLVVVEPVEVVEKPKVISVQDRTLNVAKDVAGDIDGFIDEILKTGKSSEEIDVWIKQRRFAPQVVKYLQNYFKFSINDIQDPDSAEGYVPGRKLNALKKFYTQLQSSLHVAKATRVQTPRVKKQKPAGELVKTFKFILTSEGLSGINPVKIIGAKEVYTFNIEKRKLTQYVALDGTFLSVKGTTIINIDPEKSLVKTVRKPDILKDFAKLGLRAVRSTFKEIKAVARPANGRSSDKTVILCAF